MRLLTVPDGEIDGIKLVDGDAEMFEGDKLGILLKVGDELG